MKRHQERMDAVTTRVTGQEEDEEVVVMWRGGGLQ
jgi:hypothetical protein